MSKILRPPGGTPRLSAPTTTAKMARRMLGASAIVAKTLPVGFYSAPALDILLALHAAEEDAHYPLAEALSVPGVVAPDLMDRWIMLLVDSGLVELRAGLLALTEAGHQLIVDLIERVFDDQRSLD